jgi:hypothetical protein
MEKGKIWSAFYVQRSAKWLSIIGKGRGGREVSLDFGDKAAGDERQRRIVHEDVTHLQSRQDIERGRRGVMPKGDRYTTGRNDRDIRPSRVVLKSVLCIDPLSRSNVKT